MILVAAVGRSGTHYTARLLQQLDLDVGHETVGRDGTASWKHITTGRFVVRKKWRRQRTTYIDAGGFTTVLHQVRHPLKVIASMQTFGEASWRYMAQFTSLTLEEPTLRRAMVAYLEWNRLIEPRADWRFQIERLSEVFETFCRYVGVEPQPMPELPWAARESRTGRYAALGWADLEQADAALAEQIREMARTYGYEDVDHAEGNG
jgi:hypothetical protein